MNDWITYQIPWQQFLMILIATGGVLLVYFKVIKLLFKRIKLNYGASESTGFLFVERLAIVLIGVFILISFLLVNPFFHGFLLLILIFLARDVLVNIILGSVIIREFNLKVGVKINMKDYEGVLFRIGWTGIHLSSEENIDFIPYRYIYEKGMSKTQQFVPSIARIVCRHNKIKDERSIIDLLKSKLITYPFLMEDRTPDIRAMEDGVEVTLGLVSTRHLNSLKDSLKKEGFEIEIIENT
ncbi:MAG: mechanosensitive ion channel [Saprospiraceae bacterium]|nr:mechanosensitive ion channel [Saprospiraceae bacterium]